MSPASPIGPLRVLIADRRGWIARALINVLDASEWRAVHCQSAVDLLHDLLPQEPHIIVLHDDLQDMALEDLLQRLRAEPSVGVLTPIVVLSTRAQRARRVELLRAGATEHFLFPSDSEALLLRLRALAVARREAERLRLAALIEIETDLYNPAGIARRSREVATDATRRKEPLSCVVFSPSRAGLRTGTEQARAIEVASELGGVIRRTARSSDVVGRIDRLVVIIAPATGQPGAQRLAERIQQALAISTASPGEVPETPGVDASARDRATDRGIAPVARAAYCAVADFARSTVGVQEMIERAIVVLSSTADSTEPPAIVGEIIPLTSAPTSSAP